MHDQIGQPEAEASNDTEQESKARLFYRREQLTNASAFIMLPLKCCKPAIARFDRWSMSPIGMFRQLTTRPCKSYTLTTLSAGCAMPNEKENR